MLAMAILIGALAATLPHSADLYVSGFFTSSVQRFYGPLSATAGTPRPISAAADPTYSRPVARRPWGIAFGPDGALFVANQTGSPGIVRISGPFTDSPGVAEPFVADGAFNDIAFGSDGNLYAAGAGPVRRYDIVTRELIGEFTRGFTLAQTRGIGFGPDGNLYVSNYDSCVSGPSGCTGTKGEIVRFDGLTGDFLGVYVPNGRGGLHAPWKLAFNARGELLVADWENGDGAILRFASPLRSSTGFPIGGRILNATAVFITRAALRPVYLAIGPDQNVYVSSSDGSGSAGSVLRFDGRTGAFIDVFVPAVDGGPRGLAFAPGAR